MLTGHYEYSDYSREALYFTKERLLSNWDRFMSEEKGEEYFKKFWRPKTEDYTGDRRQITDDRKQR